MRTSGPLSLFLAAAGTQVIAQTSVSVGAPSTTVTPAEGGPATGKLGNATVVKNNPQGVVYQAVFPSSAAFKPAFPEGENIRGSISATASPGGEGVVFTINWTNLPKAGGPFMYHLHVNPVPDNGNCTATLAHLDPFIRGEDPICDKAHPETCQTGDLSGKIGDIPQGQDSFTATYLDLYSSTLEGLGSFFGNRSIVFHYANKTRVTCANFEKVAGPDHSSASESVCSSTATAHPTGHANLTTTTRTPSGTSAPSASNTPSGPARSIGSSLQASAAGVIAFAAAFMFML